MVMFYSADGGTPSLPPRLNADGETSSLSPRLNGDGGELHGSVRSVFLQDLLSVEGDLAAGEQGDADERRRVAEQPGLQIQIAFRDDFRLRRR